MNWLTSWPSVMIGAIGLLACAVGLLVEALVPLWDAYKSGKEADEHEECGRENAGTEDR